MADTNPKLEAQLERWRSSLLLLNVWTPVAMVLRWAINTIGPETMRDMIVDLAEAMVDDGNDTGIDERTTEAYAKSMVIDRAGRGFDTFNGWLR